MVSDICVHFVIPKLVSLSQMPIKVLLTFVWGSGLSSSDFILRLNTAYSEVVHWRQNLFTVPHCSAGHSFIKELSSLYRAYGDSTSLETVALEAAMVLPPLLLQRPHRRSTSHGHKRCLEHRLQLWKDGDLLQLLQEGRTVQQRLQSSRAHSSQDTAKVFARLMFQGKVKAALRLLSSNSRGDFLPLDAAVGNNTVLDELKKKHPTSSPINYDSLINPEFPPSETCHQVIFEGLDEAVIRESCLKTEGAAGPSGIDSAGWRRMCTSFQPASTDLCRSLAFVVLRIAASYVDSVCLSPLLACRLIVGISN